MTKSDLIKAFKDNCGTRENHTLQLGYMYQYQQNQMDILCKDRLVRIYKDENKKCIITSYQRAELKPNLIPVTEIAFSEPVKFVISESEFDEMKKLFTETIN